MNAPTPDDSDPMRAALRRDAARVPEPAFDAALHYATMRRVRALSESGSARAGWRPRLAWAAVAVIVGLAALMAFSLPRSSPPARPRAVTVTPTSPTAPRASLLAYQEAASESDATLFAMLDQDAASLLPASSPVFSATLP